MTHLHFLCDYFSVIRVSGSGYLVSTAVCFSLSFVDALGVEPVSMSEADKVRNGVLVQLPVPLNCRSRVSISMYRMIERMKRN